MDWKPITRAELDDIVARETGACSGEQRSFFASVAISPVKWQQSPWGDQGGGFWAVAVVDDRVLWYNDIERGFNVSRFQTEGVIPSGEYWCNQDPLAVALAALAGHGGSRLGPPEPVPEE